MPAENGDSLALGLTRAADSDKFHLWEKGLPNADDLVPLNQSLITPVLAHAFSIKEALPSQGHRDQIEPEHPAQAAVRTLLQSACSQRERGAQELQLLPRLPRRDANGSTSPPDDVSPAKGNGAEPRFLQSQKTTSEFLDAPKQGGAPPAGLTPKQQKPAGSALQASEEAGLAQREAGSSKKGAGEEGRIMESRPNGPSEKGAGKSPGAAASNGKAEGEGEEREGKKRRREQEDQGRRREREGASPDDEDGFVPGGKPLRNGGAWDAMDNASGDEAGGKGKSKGTDGGANGEGGGSKRAGRDTTEESDSVERLQKEEADGEGGEDEQDGELGKSGSEKKRSKKPKSTDDDGNEDSGGENNSSDDLNPRTLKRPRLVWTPQLHKRFVDAVSHLGIKNAVPKTIMQLMNVEGLTRENVASHLQKYRLYLKRMQGVSPDAPSASDHHLFGSAPMPPSMNSPPQQRMGASHPGASSVSAGIPGIHAPGSLGQRDPSGGPASATVPGGPQMPMGLGAGGFLGSGMPGGGDPNAAGMAAAAAAAAALGGSKHPLLNDQLAQSLGVGGDTLGRTLNAYAAAAAAAYDMQRQQLPFLPHNINPLLMAGGGLPAWANLAAGGLPAGSMAGAGLPGGPGMGGPGGLNAAALGGNDYSQGAASGPGALAAASGLMGSGGYGSSGPMMGASRGLAGMAGLTSAGGLSLGGLGVDAAAASAAMAANAAAAAMGHQGPLARGPHGAFGGLERKDGSREQLTLAMAPPESPRPHSPPKRALNLFPE